VNRRECVSAAIEHRGDGKVPVDFGSTSVTGIHVPCVAQLREHYGVERRLGRVVEPYQMLGGLDDDLLDAPRMDTIGLTADGSLV
jgi:hypothetical protein